MGEARSTSGTPAARRTERSRVAAATSRKTASWRARSATERTSQSAWWGARNSKFCSNHEVSIGIRSRLEPAVELVIDSPRLR